MYHHYHLDISILPTIHQNQHIPLITFIFSIELRSVHPSYDLDHSYHIDIRTMLSTIISTFKFQLYVFLVMMDANMPYYSQHYNKIKRDNTSGNGGSSANGSPEKPKSATAGRGRKRKATEAEVDDDAQVATTNGRSSRVKKEPKPKKERAQSVAIFKADPADEQLIDVDDDDG